MTKQIRTDRLIDLARKSMLKNGLEVAFPPEVKEEAESIRKASEVKTESFVRNLRALLWSSIDNSDSRDLDQVEYAEELPNGDIRLLVGIADVDALVHKGTPIDEFAAKNTVTVYTDAGNFPMLPDELSTGLTSLNEGEDRLAIVVELKIKSDGSVPGNGVFRAVVRNRAKLDYGEVGEWLDSEGDMPEKIAAIPGLDAQILLQHRAAVRLHNFRKEKGALEFESIESAPIVKDGEIIGIASIGTNSARRIIENFMIAANVEIAEFLRSKGSLSIQRVVKTPERWDGIREIAAELGTELPAEPDTQALASFLEEQKAADPLHYPDLSLSIVKLIGGGDYVVQEPGERSDGHFSLAVQGYTHSTAPNRRYSDLIVQRLVKCSLSDDESPYTAEELEEIVEHCNKQESAARRVERKIRKIAAAGVMERHIGETFEAIVTGKTPNGTFARILRPPVDGRVVQGEDGVEVGEKIDVRLLNVEPDRGFIDFAVLTND